MAHLDDSNTPENDDIVLEEELRRLAVRLTFGINEYDRPLIELLREMRDSLKHKLPAQQVAEYVEQLGKYLGKDAYKSPEQLLLELPMDLFGQLLAAPRVPGKQRKQLLDLAQLVVKEKGSLNSEPWYTLLQNLEQAVEQAPEVALGSSTSAKESRYTHIEEVLLNLLEVVAFPEHETEKVDTMKSALQSGVGIDQLLECVHDIAKFVGQHHQEETRQRESLESFLVEMKQNLHDMQSLVKSLVQDQTDTFQITNSFGRTLQKNILAMKRQFDSAHDFESLKRDIKSSINQISSSLEQFTASASNRQVKIHQQMQQVSARMNALEIVSEVLKERLISERRMAMQDPLTGVNNRMAYNQRIVDELERFERYKTPFVLSVWDLDRFKGINDQYGHQAGDRVLKALAEILVNNIRRVDFVARYGGEEFVIIIPNTTISGAMNLAEKIRRQVEKMHFHHNGQQVEVTISAGLAEVRPKDTVEALFQRADDALYRAKKGGRNRCEAAM